MLEIEYWVNRYHAAGLAVQITGKPRDGLFQVKVQSLFGDWMIPGPWEEVVEESLISASSPEIQSLFQVLAALPLGLLPPMSGALDGESHSLKIQAGSSIVSFSWPCELPECWASLEPVVEVLTAFAKQRIEPSSEAT